MDNEASLAWLDECLTRSQNEIFSEVKVVTPVFSDCLLLQANKENRGIREAKLGQMVEDMKSGRWLFNGEPIIISKTGELNDGQHRLFAIKNSGVECPMLFVFGVERETRTTVDQGSARSVADVLRIDNVPNATTLAGITRLLLAYERKGSVDRTRDISTAETLERVGLDESLAESAIFAAHHSKSMKGMASPSVIGFCHKLFTSIHVAEGQKFMEQVCAGEEIRRNDPAYTARERLRSLERRIISHQVEVIFRAWNAYRDRRELKAIAIRGQLPELV